MPGRFLRNGFDDFSRNSPYDDIRGDILCNYRSGRYNRVVADGDALQDGCVRADPNILSELNRCRISRFTFFGRESVVKRGENHVVPDLAAIAECYAAVILKVAAGIDKDFFADLDILAEIGVKRWKNP